MNYYLFPIGYCVSSGSRSRQGSGKIVNLINSQQTYGLDGEEGESSCYFLQQGSHLAWIEVSDSGLPVEHSAVQRYAAMASFPVAHRNANFSSSQDQQSSPRLAETQTAWLSLGMREPRIYPPGAGQED